MLRLRKILLCNYLYFFLLLLVSILTICRINLNHKSYYSLNTKEVIGKLVEYNIDGNELKLTIRAKENLIANYYFENINSKRLFIKSINLGDTLKIKGEFYLKH